MTLSYLPISVNIITMSMFDSCHKYLPKSNTVVQAQLHKLLSQGKITNHTMSQNFRLPKGQG